MNDVLFIPLPGESVHYGPSELLFCLDSSYNIPVHVQLSQLRLSYSKKPKNTNDDVTIVDQSVELFKNIRNHIPINSIIKLETCSKRTGDFQVVYFTESDENILEIPKADPVFSFKLTTAADVFTFKEKETKKNKIPFLVNAILELIHRGNKNLVPVSLDFIDPIFIDPNGFEVDSVSYLEKFLHQFNLSDHSVHSKNAEFKCRSYPKYNIKPNALKDDFFSKNSYFQHNRFVRWHYHHGGVNMYSCGGTPKNSTKETIEGYNKLIGQLKTKLNVRIFDLTIIEVTDEILLFFDSIRIHKANKELDKHFHSTFSKSGIPYAVCQMLNKAFNIVNCLNLGQSVLLTETSETNNLIFTPIMTSLVQIIIEERCRTIDGICDIVDREWMLGGHDFISRKAYPSFGWIVFIEAVNHLFNEIDFTFNQNLLSIFLHSPLLGIFEQFSFHNCRHKTQKLQQNTCPLPSFGYFIKTISPIFSTSNPIGFRPQFHGSVQDLSSCALVKEKKTPIKKLKHKLKSAMSRRNILHSDNTGFDQVWFMPHVIKVSNGLANYIFHQNVIFENHFETGTTNKSVPVNGGTKSKRRIIGPVPTDRVFPARPSMIWGDERGRKFLMKIGPISGPKRLSANSSAL